jgi:pimeloyl-ACP methyl ester carboxylesterase
MRGLLSAARSLICALSQTRVTARDVTGATRPADARSSGSTACERDRHELTFHRPAHAGRPRLGLRGAELPEGSDHAVRHYVNTLACDPEALRASFAFYRAFDTDIAQNARRKARRLTLPVLAIGGAESSGEMVANTMKLAADDVQSLVIPGCGH